MSYGWNDNMYVCLKGIQSYDVFDKCKMIWPIGTHVGSVVVNSIIVDVNDRETVEDIEEGQDYIDKMIELGYVKLIA